MTLLNWLVATDIDEVGVSAFDFYSIGHICFGLGVVLFFSLFYLIPKHHNNNPIFPLWLVFVLSMGVLIAWEFIENLLFLELGIKFEKRADSVINITTDLILGTIGAVFNTVAAYEVGKKNRHYKWYYLEGLIAFGIWLIIFVILRYLTYWASAVY
ncbi:MAG: hypothetical protein ACOC35_02445 [Promethearchaeia archaeon]